MNIEDVVPAWKRSGRQPPDYRRHRRKSLAIYVQQHTSSKKSEFDSHVWTRWCYELESRAESGDRKVSRTESQWARVHELLRAESRARNFVESSGLGLFFFPPILPLMVFATGGQTGKKTQ